MIRLKLNLPDGVVNYNEYGTLVSVPVAYAPNQIKSFGIPVEIAGYIADSQFFAYSLKSTARDFTLSEQLTLLRSVGFLTVPYVMNEETAGDSLITTRNQFSRYGATWINTVSGEEFAVPTVINIESTEWSILDHTLVLVIHADNGETYTRADLRNIEYFQPGAPVKVFNKQLMPYRSSQIVNPIPSHCPKCNNPLKKVQIYADLPLFYKCTSSFCDKLVVDDVVDEVEIEVPETEADITPEVEVSPQIDAGTSTELEASTDAVSSESVTEEEPVVEATETVADTTVDDDDETINAVDIMGGDVEVIDTEEEAPAIEEPVEAIEVAEGEEATITTEEPTANKSVLRVINLECTEYPESDEIQYVDETEEADYILTKTKRSVTKKSRELASERNIELISVAELEELINE